MVPQVLPVDSHCHLTDFGLLSIEQWRAGLTAIFTCGYSRESSLAGLELSRRNPGFVYAIAGESPQRVMNLPEPRLDWLSGLEGIVAIGEIGLDRHWGKSEAQLSNQKKWFLAQLELAQELGLPVVIHSRDAESEVLDILERAAPNKVLMHCFSGSPEEARRAAGLGYSATVAPGRSKQRRKVIKAMDADYLMLESDSPYLGKTPLSVLDSAELVSREKGLEVKEAIALTSANAMRFYGVG
jgi:TatD DNase family protein